MTDVESTVDQTDAATMLAAASLVPDAERMTFLPRFFGAQHLLKGEFLVYEWMGNLCQDYNGGFWNFYTLKNGGFYMAPASGKRLRVICRGNGFDGEMTADAAGIVATLFTLCQLAFETELDRFSDLFHSLRAFAASHSEASAILSAID